MIVICLLFIQKLLVLEQCARKHGNGGDGCSAVTTSAPVDKLDICSYYCNMTSIYIIEPINVLCI
jgi:hypothetical protein